MAERNIDVINPYSGQIATVNKEEETLYYIIKNAEIDKLIKQYKKINKFRKSNLYQVAKMDGKDTYVEKLVNDFGIDSEAIE